MKVRSITNAFTDLFINKKGNITRLNHKGLYYKSYFSPKNLCDGIYWVSKMERTSKKAAAQILMEQGFSSYMGDKVKQELDRQRVRREKN